MGVRFQAVFSSTPVVLSQVQTHNDSHWVNTRQQNVTSNGFQVALEEEEARTTAHASRETIGWLAIEPGEGTWTSHAFEAAHTANAVTNAWPTIAFAGGDGLPVRAGQVVHFVASLASYGGTDNAHLRYRALSGDGAEVKVEEDTSWDTEMGHTTEGVHHLAFVAEGTLRGQARATTTSYYCLGGQRVAMRRGNVLTFLIGDHPSATLRTGLSSTTLAIDEYGNLVAESWHYPYGEERWRSPQESTVPTDYRSTGQRYPCSLVFSNPSLQGFRSIANFHRLVYTIQMTLVFTYAL